ncbi:serine/threonine protein kinase [Nocardiopsis dassonvillei]|uniref:serine/threonine-protein kinase n=1 Tax=Nocardiopsis dassonvillei TaxID=2014 RepID=UPI00200C60D4|nr:serine/threonine-protein kinase [Nocardiopsis dassonvillei]MCK9869283.1 serine/threonine protein kinase [Nocardiopsis dassonvillei]
MTVTPAPVPPPPRDTGLPPGLKPLEKGDPRTLGPYRIVGRIGAGGMGAVYGGIDGGGRCVAVKTVHARFARGRGHREAFAREVDMLARARGVSTARLYDADTTARVPWLAFDYVPGRNLRAHVRAFGPLEGEMLRAFATGTAEGLAALHSAGIAHRDIKPGNVILSPDGPKIVDFGIATAVGTRRANDRGASYGTPGWVAPERYTGAVADPAADVFAWGALVALAATGREPFGRGTPEQLRQRVTAGRHDLEGVPDDVLPLVEAALATDPARRPRAVELIRRGSATGGDDASDRRQRQMGISDRGGTAGGALTALAGSKAAVAGAGVLVAAGLATGGYVVYDRVGGAPAEAVTAAATTLEEGGGFVVEVERRFSDAHAEEVAARTGQAVEAVLEESTATVEYRYAADRDVFLASGEVMGQGSVAAADSGGRLYVYGPALAEGEASDPVDPAWEATAEDLGPELVTGPLRAMAESPDLEAGGAGEEGGRVYIGPLTSRLVVDGEVVEEDAEGFVEVDERGGPVRMEYAGDLWRVRADFTEVGGPAEVADPQQGEESGGGRLEVLHAPACGEFEFYERDWLVRADAWEMSCDRALEVAGLLGSEGGRSELASGYTGSGVHTHFVDGELACVGVREFVPGLSGAESPWSLVSCTSATSLGESEFGWEELEFGESVLIRFVRVE